MILTGKMVLTGKAARSGRMRARLAGPMRRPRAGLAAALACWLAAGGPAAAADYVIRAGDVLDFSIPSLQLQRRLSVGPDKMISLPLAGDIRADGVPLSELAKQIKSAFSGKAYTMRTIDGKEIPTAVTPEEIVVTVAEYRPVYVNGDVSKPGAQGFRPGMTVRQAVALSGGYDLVHFRLDNPFAQIYDMRADYEAAWVDYLRLTARIKRVRSALGLPPPPPGPPETLKNPLTPVATATIEKAQDEEIGAKLTQTNDQIKSIARQIDGEDLRLKTLTSQSEKEQQGAQLDASEEQRISDLVQRGTAPISRAADARRLSLLSATRVLQVDVQADAVRKETADFKQTSQRLANELTLYLNQELEACTSQLVKATAKRDRLWQKIVYSGVLQSQLVSGPTNAPEIFISRMVDQNWQRLPADEDSSLDPGDVVDVRLRIATPEAGR
jgi:polysaccharide biosynthesis/export protein